MKQENHRTSENVPEHLTNDRDETLRRKRGLRSCDTCYYSVEMRQPGSPLEWMRICKWGPPGIAIGPSPQGGAGVIPLDKICPSGHWCFQWRSLPVGPQGNGPDSEKASA